MGWKWDLTNSVAYWDPAPKTEAEEQEARKFGFKPFRYNAINTETGETKPGTVWCRSYKDMVFLMLLWGATNSRYGNGKYRFEDTENPKEMSLT